MGRSGRYRFVQCGCNCTIRTKTVRETNPIESTANESLAKNSAAGIILAPKHMCPLSERVLRAGLWTAQLLPKSKVQICFSKQRLSRGLMPVRWTSKAFTADPTLHVFVSVPRETARWVRNIRHHGKSWKSSQNATIFGVCWWFIVRARSRS